MLAAVEFAEASPEPALDTLYENLYVLESEAGWYAVDERSPEPHRGEREERRCPTPPASWPKPAPPTPASPPRRVPTRRRRATRSSASSRRSRRGEVEVAEEVED